MIWTQIENCAKILWNSYSTNILGPKHSDNGDVLLCGGRIGDGEVMSDCVAYTPKTKVSIWN